MCVRSWGLLLNSLGARGVILGVLGASWAAFWVLWGSLGYVFGGFGGRLGSILEALGDPWAPFWRLWGALGLHFGNFGDLWWCMGAPLAAQGAQSRIFLNLSLPFWELFGYILEVKYDQKSDIIFD